MGLISKLFTFTNGAGNLIDATQVNADLDALYTLLCGAPSGGTQGQLSKENMALAFAKDNVEPIYPQWKPIYTISMTGLGVTTAARLITGANLELPFDVDPTQFVAGSRSVKFRVRAMIGTNQVAPAANIFVAVSPMTLVPGVSGADNTWTIGAAATQVTFTAPGASGVFTGVSGAVSLPAGIYNLVIASNVNAAAGSRIAPRAWLEVQQT